MNTVTIKAFCSTDLDFHQLRECKILNHMRTGHYDRTAMLDQQSVNQQALRQGTSKAVTAAGHPTVMQLSGACFLTQAAAHAVYTPNASAVHLRAHLLLGDGPKDLAAHLSKDSVLTSVAVAKQPENSACASVLLCSLSNASICSVVSLKLNKSASLA